MITPFNRGDVSRQRLRADLATCLFVAILLLMALTPVGMVPLFFLKLTLLHIPVILASLILGPLRGLFLGFSFGLSSLLVNTFTPSLLSFAFSPLIPVYGQTRGQWSALLICFLPRLLLGWLPGFLFQQWEKNPKLDLSGSRKLRRIEGILAGGATILHTLLVLFLLGLFFGEPIALLRQGSKEEAWRIIAGLCLVNGVPESLLAAILIPSLTQPIRRILYRNQRKDFI